MSIENAKKAILSELVSDFRQRRLGSADLQSEYEGVPCSILEQACLARGVGKVDYDLALEELEEEESIGTGPQAMTESIVTAGLVFLPMPYSKREYAFLCGKGYKAALKNGVQQPAKANTVIHGDQIVNYGNAGAVGRYAVGTINQQQQWASVASQIDLAEVVTELQTLRTELMKTAKTPTDFQQLSLVAEAEQHAEKHDGPKLMEVLSKSGKWLLDFATHVGTDITAKLLARQWG